MTTLDETRASLAVVREALLGKGELPQIEDPEQVQREIMRQILSATSVEQVLAGQQTLSAEDVLNVPLEIHDVRWHRSSLQGGPGVFALIEATRIETGEIVLVTTSGTNVLAQLLKLLEIGEAIPPLMITQSPRETARGYRPQWLVAVQGPPVE